MNRLRQFCQRGESNLQTLFNIFVDIVTRADIYQ